MRIEHLSSAVLLGAAALLSPQVLAAEESCLNAASPDAASPDATALLALKAAKSKEGAVYQQEKAAVGPIDAAMRTGGPAFEISTSTDGSSAALNFTLKSRGGSEVANGLCQVRIKHQAFDLLLKAPLDSDGGAREFANLDGLATGVSAALKFSVSFTNAPKPDLNNLSQVLQSGVALSTQECKRRWENYNAEMPIENTKSDSEIVALCMPKSDRALEKSQFVENYLPRYFSEHTPSHARTFIVSGAGAVGYDKLDYLDPTNLETKDRKGVQYDFNLAATYLINSSAFAVTFGGEYEHSFDQNDVEILCLAALPGDAPECASGRPGEPLRSGKARAYLEMRKAFKVSFVKSGGIGIAPRITRDFTKDITGVSLPIYYVPRDPNALTGGLQFGWRDDTDDLTAGVFVGGRFSLFD